MAYGKSDKLDAHPLTEKSRRDHCSLAPGRDFHQREGFPQFQGEQLGQCIGRGTNLHPQFQSPLRLLPQVRHPPPSLQVVEQRLDTPAFGVDFHHGLSRQFRLGGQNQARTRPGVVVLTHLAPHRPHGHPLQESRHGDGRAQPDQLQFAVQHQIHFLRWQCIQHGCIESLPVFSFRPPAFRFWFRRQVECRIPSHLTDDAYPLFEQG
ncbi:hypothetical protein FEMY_24880 [Ferrovum myxofaciens]|uniref:Uncharacterized protein n=1 Tax=Ferrovum myxofaciens TaxID=416213 RepID=A0A149VVN6_9PROT|nr:hypothetical protein FEMY_24880 [Ferrovum myxofaciens]